MRHQLKSMFMKQSATPSPTAAKTNESITRTEEMKPPTSQTANIIKSVTTAGAGTHLADFDGKSLYVFDKDTAGVSNCTGACATLWPAYTSGATAEKNLPTGITVIKRSDGGTQFAWNGKPLYYYSKDLKPGDTLGDGINGVWHLIRM